MLFIHLCVSVCVSGVWTYVYLCALVHMCLNTCRPAIDARNYSVTLYLILWVGPFMKHRSYQLRLASELQETACSWPSPSILGWQTCVIGPGFYLGADDPNSGPLLHKSSPQPKILLWFTWKIKIIDHCLQVVHNPLLEKRYLHIKYNNTCSEWQPYNNRGVLASMTGILSLKLNKM